MTIQPPELPRLHVVTDDGRLAEAGFAERALQLVRGARGGALHIRGPTTSGRRIFEIARDLMEPVREAGWALLINDRVDISRALDADGVHLGQRSLPVRAARALLTEGRLVGVSVHSSAEAVEAAGGGASYLLVGSVFETPSHRDRPTLEPAGLERVTRATRLSALAIGGVSPERVGSCLEAGAVGVAVVRGVWDHPDLGSAAAEYLAALDTHLDGVPRPSPATGPKGMDGSTEGSIQ